MYPITVSYFALFVIASKRKLRKSFFLSTTIKDNNREGCIQTSQRFLDKHNLNLKMICSICTDGAPAMLGNYSGFAAMLKKEIPELKVTHCLLHRQALAFKTLPPCLKNVLNSCVKIVNYIKGHALNHRLFLSLCQDVNQNDNHVLLYHTEVRWLSRG